MPQVPREYRHGHCNSKHCVGVVCISGPRILLRPSFGAFRSLATGDQPSRLMDSVDAAGICSVSSTTSYPATGDAADRFVLSTVCRICVCSSSFSFLRETWSICYKKLVGLGYHYRNSGDHEFSVISHDCPCLIKFPCCAHVVHRESIASLLEICKEIDTSTGI
uniref:Uncharacterized protein n=1 Tax=Physcomitrium patens TaxID=3218 RepID=A0A2K1IXX8_PHYPA|nr:hypothetical protein PHYPA_023951 [Physcomitrium patens]